MNDTESHPPSPIEQLLRPAETTSAFQRLIHSFETKQKAKEPIAEAPRVKRKYTKRKKRRAPYGKVPKPTAADFIDFEEAAIGSVVEVVTQKTDGRMEIVSARLVPQQALLETQLGRWHAGLVIEHGLELLQKYDPEAAAVLAKTWNRIWKSGFKP